jgi:RsiW-degrading membrane proteinase PrsW (M82 family)
MPQYNLISIAFFGGILPAILWLLFWLREDARHPESSFAITKTFVAGMCMVVLVLPFQRLVDSVFPGMTPVAFFFWALIEEVFKFAAAYFIVIRTREDDEPVDTLIYMITVALGFVALENALFIFNPLIQEDFVGALTSGTFRFVGASLLHVVSSASIGVCLALSFYKKTLTRVLAGSLGLILAVIIHTGFNLFLIDKGSTNTLWTFGSVWIAVAVLLLFFEKIKALRPN